jgi:hypothetical protein
MLVCKAALACWNWDMLARNRGVVETGLGADLIGEQSAILNGVTGFLGDLVTSLVGDLTGEQSKSINLFAVTCLGLLEGNRVFVGVGTRDCLEGDLAWVLDLGAGERNRD